MRLRLNELMYVGCLAAVPFASFKSSTRARVRPGYVTGHPSGAMWRSTARSCAAAGKVQALLLFKQSNISH